MRILLRDSKNSNSDVPAKHEPRTEAQGSYVRPVPFISYSLAVPRLLSRLVGFLSLFINKINFSIAPVRFILVGVGGHQADDERGSGSSAPAYKHPSILVLASLLAVLCTKASKGLRGRRLDHRA